LPAQVVTYGFVIINLTIDTATNSNANAAKTSAHTQEHLEYLCV
jgi:hypothetical protein